MSMFSESLRAFLKPVAGYLDDPEVSEILINGPKEIWVEKRGKLQRTEATFTEEGLLAAARNMAQYVGRPLTDERPRLDARLPDGSRIHVVLPPVARRGTTISIRKFFAEKLTVAKLIELGSISRRMARLLEAAVGLRLNLVVSGGSGSGKTSLLNVLTQFIAQDERILTIEDSAELQLTQPHVVSFESRPADRLGKGEVGIGDLLHSALRLRPDRIVVGEVRGGECFHLLQAMNTGHGGTLTTAHANTPVDTLRRLESLCLLSGVELPLIAVRAQVASALHLVVCCERFSDGTRKITKVSEVLPLDERGEYRVQDLVQFEQTGKEASGRVLGQFAATGARPTFFARLAASGYPDVDESYFTKGPHPDTDPQVTAVEHVPESKPAEPKAPPDQKPAPRPPAEAKPPPAPRKAADRTPPAPVRKPDPPRAPEASIELDPELQREVEARLHTESTLITRNPLERRRDEEDTQPGTRRRP
jgi:pilus assembly protein CpaF